MAQSASSLLGSHCKLAQSTPGDAGCILATMPCLAASNTFAVALYEHGDMNFMSKQYVCGTAVTAHALSTLSAGQQFSMPSLHLTCLPSETKSGRSKMQ